MPDKKDGSYRVELTRSTASTAFITSFSTRRTPSFPSFPLSALHLCGISPPLDPSSTHNFDSRVARAPQAKRRSSLFQHHSSPPPPPSQNTACGRIDKIRCQYCIQHLLFHPSHSIFLVPICTSVSLEATTSMCRHSSPFFGS